MCRKDEGLEEVVVTPEMLSAGLKVWRDNYFEIMEPADKGVWPAVIKSVYRAMVMASSVELDAVR